MIISLALSLWVTLTQFSHRGEIKRRDERRRMARSKEQKPLCVERWEEALHEIGRVSFATVLSPQSTAALLKSVEDVLVLVVAGAEDALAPLKSTQAIASNLANSVGISESGVDDAIQKLIACGYKVGQMELLETSD